MPWNWQLSGWPKFTYDPELISQQEKKFLLGIGSTLAFLKTIETGEYNQFMVEILSLEGQESSRIEGELLDRKSLQSSIKKQFGLEPSTKSRKDKESRMAQVLCDVYRSFDRPLTHQMLWKWHGELFSGEPSISDTGKYRTHKEPMQIVSHRIDLPKVFFEAPPSAQVPHEMDAFIRWFNGRNHSGSILGKTAVAHIYFESIHPFEDGNGRIGRVLMEKLLSQEVGRPTLMAVSKTLEKQKKEYYAALERCNRTLEIHHAVEFFAGAILEAQEESLHLLHFLIGKSKLFLALAGEINPRQEEALLRMFAEGLGGFKGGLSADNYIAITKASKATATRDLADLVQKGALVKTGELRHTRYWLNVKFP